MFKAPLLISHYSAHVCHSLMCLAAFIIMCKETLIKLTDHFGLASQPSASIPA